MKKGIERGRKKINQKRLDMINDTVVKGYCRGTFNFTEASCVPAFSNGKSTSSKPFRANLANTPPWTFPP
eukprot:1331681-Amphidinium_carterae.1